MKPPDYFTIYSLIIAEVRFMGNVAARCAFLGYNKAYGYNAGFKMVV